MTNKTRKSRQAGVYPLQASKNHKAFMADLKPVYRAVSKETAETALDKLEEKWGQS